MSTNGEWSKCTHTAVEYGVDTAIYVSALVGLSMVVVAITVAVILLCNTTGGR